MAAQKVNDSTVIYNKTNIIFNIYLDFQINVN